MDLEIIFRDSFVDDPERPVRSIASHNSVAAGALGEKIIQMAEGLSFFPERHPRVRQRPTLRRFIVKKHFKVFYRVNVPSRTVEILRLGDGRQANNPRL